MHNSTLPAGALLRRIAQFITWTLIFAAAYAQSPLYTSNQNQYFLHGMARAGYGFLNRDWLANTLDPTPVFSLLVELTYRFLQLEALFYIYYALLMGVYLFSLIGIMREIISFNSTSLILFLALVVAAHSAALRFILSRTLGVNWTYILEDGVADQRLLGPVFQPSTFGVLLVLSIFLFLRRRPYLAVLSAALAATLHPTYLLGAGVLTFSYLLVAFMEERRLDRPVRIGVVAAVSVVPILFYVFRSFGGTALQAAAQAQEILVNFRIPHHAVIGQWLDATVAAKLLLVSSTLYLVRNTRLFLILFTAALAAVALTTVQVLLDSTSLALIFPWRLSIFLVPLCTAIWLARIADWTAVRARDGARTGLPRPPDVQLEIAAEAVEADHQDRGPIRHSKLRGRMESLLLAGSAGVIFVSVMVGAVRFKLDLDRKAAGPERAMEEFVAENRSPTDLYLIPVKLQDFRLASGAPAFVDFKSIPYKDADVVEWYRRVQLADLFYKAPNCEQLADLVKQEGVTHLVLEGRSPRLSCEGIVEVYQDGAYGVYALSGPRNSARPHLFLQLFRISSVD